MINSITELEKWVIEQESIDPDDVLIKVRELKGVLESAVKRWKARNGTLDKVHILAFNVVLYGARNVNDLGERIDDTG